MQNTTNPANLRVIVADDHRLIRHGLIALLSVSPAIEVIAEAGNGDALVALAKLHQPDVVIADIHMPEMGGLVAACLLRESSPGTRILFISMDDSIETLRHAYSLGGHGFLAKTATARELEHAVREVVSAGLYMPKETKIRLKLAANQSGAMTPRQVEILALLASGLSSKEIGYKLGLSSKTIDVHRARISDRLGIQDTAGLTRYALRLGLV